MYIDVPWDTSSVPVKIEDDRLAGIVESKTVKVRDEAALLHEVLQGARRDAELHRLARRSARDRSSASSTTPRGPRRRARCSRSSRTMLEGRDIGFMVATGAHRPPGEDELVQIFGTDLRGRYLDRIAAHDARDRDSLVFLGETPARHAHLDQPRASPRPRTWCC